ncbi:MAG: hypothetical protein IT428_03360 [Planctomycetaceae bacterium]|nr:hypothetical protein [Planctomycetaceae bacterium]
MENPFHRRATEQLRDDEAFLSIVSPQPLSYFLKRPAEKGTLYDRLVMLGGTPGSGKTTLARLFEFSALSAVLRSTGSTDYESVAGALEQCGAIKEGVPALLGCRLPMETDYREFWQFPYNDALKSGLLFTFIQSRAILSWFRQLQAAGVAPSEVTLIAERDSGSGLDAIGGSLGEQVLRKARDVERAVYEIVGSLVPPMETELSTAVTGTYRPFDVISKIQLQSPAIANVNALQLMPLVILDDAHWLHPAQFESVKRWLARRELHIARWIISRFDILQPSEALQAVSEDRSEKPAYPGLSAERDIEVVLLQSWASRRDQRNAFRKMGRDMAERYLHKHSLLGQRRLVDITSFLSKAPQSLSTSKTSDLSNQIASTQARLKISNSRRKLLEESIIKFQGNDDLGEDVRLAMLGVLLHRYFKRTKGQASLFGDDPEPPKPTVANDGVYEAALLHLMHHFERPYFFGADTLCDASSENAELFLQLSAILVDTVATQVIRSRPALLDASTQHRLLRERATRMIDAWSFPYFERVRSLVRLIASKCVETSLQPNGWLTPNAYGLLQAEFDFLASSNSEVGRVLQFAVAYNALLVVPRYDCKGKEWCLLELGGPVCLSLGLTLKRGGFLEGSVAELGTMIEETLQ